MLLGWLALLGKCWCTPYRGDKVNVAAAAVATRGNNYLLTWGGKISNLIKRLLCNWIKLAHNGSQRHLEQQILSVRAMTASTLTVSTALSLKVMFVAVINQRRELRICNNDNIAAVTAIATVRTTFWYICFSAERHAACAAVSAFNVNMTKISESFHVSSF